MADSKTIWVKAGEKVGDKVALWEVDDRHPANSLGAHEAFVAGQDSEPQEVYPTVKVLTKIKDDELVQVTKKGTVPANPIKVDDQPPIDPNAQPPVTPSNPSNGEG